LSNHPLLNSPTFPDPLWLSMQVVSGHPHKVIDEASCTNCINATVSTATVKSVSQKFKCHITATSHTEHECKTLFSPQITDSSP